jgi:hypothetical protein
MDNKGMGVLILVGIIAVALLMSGLLIWSALNSATPETFMSTLTTICIIALIAGGIVALALFLIGRG